MNQKRICIIGSGVSGLVGIKSCLEEGLTPVCFESSTDFGGLWRFTETVDGKACVMRTTIINTSKEIMAYSDFPPPKENANYMHNTKVLEYMQTYAREFQLEQFINFNCEVKSVKKAENYSTHGQWTVTYERKKTTATYTTLDGSEGTHKEVFDAVLVGTGHHATPNRVDFPGLSEFSGPVLHSHDLRDPTDRMFLNKNVIVVGIGNSSVDISVDLSKSAKNVFLSTRRGAWLLTRVGPKGRPSDIMFLTRFLQGMAKLLGENIMNGQFEKVCSERIDHELYGLKPTFRPRQAHPTMNDELPNRIISGTVKVKQNIKHFYTEGMGENKKNCVEFEDGSVETGIDIVILATGYSMTFPFIDPEVFTVKENQFSLFKYVFPPALPHATMAFIGYIQPWGAIQPMAELQCRWAALVFNGRVQLPSREKMEEDIKEKQEAIRKRYVASPRHTCQVEAISYMDEIAEMVGCKPEITLWAFIRDPVLMWQMVFGPCTPYQYRLKGPHTWSGARNAILTQNERIEFAFKTRKSNASASSGGGLLHLSYFVFLLAVIFGLFWKFLL